MNKKDTTLKLVFGLIILLFSLAFSYFTASYLNQNHYLDYWLTLLLFSVVYLVFGMLIAQIYPISFGLLFSADVLLLNLLLENFGRWSNDLKSLAVFGILVVLYLIAYFKFPDRATQSQSATSIPPVDSSQTLAG